MRKRFTHAFVTGGGSGLGRGFAEELAARGCAVSVGDLKAETAEATAELLRATGARATSCALDVRDPAAFEAAFAAAEAALGPIDLLVNNAGVMVGGGIDRLPLEDFKFTLDINLLGAIHGYHVAAPRFRDRRAGHFINVSSIAGVLNPPETAPYNVSKAGVLALAETAYAELGIFGVGTTVLCPSAVRTGIFDAMKSDNPMHRKLALRNARSFGPREPRQVAAITLDAAERDRLYVFPHLDARVGWWFKRWFPGLFAKLSRAARTNRWLERSAGG